MTKRIHIVGAPRSGTTLLAELMTACFRFDAQAEHEMSIFKVPKTDVGLFCSKNPQDVLYLRPLLAIDKNLWGIYLIRDPRDVVVSRHGKSPDQYWSNLSVWKIYHQASRKMLGHPRFIVVRYEDLVSNPDEAQRKLIRSIPFLERLSTFSDFHKIAKPSEGSLQAMRGIRPVNSDSIGAWRKNKPRLASQLMMHGPITQELIDLGYEADDGWLSELDGVTPDNHLSHLTEKFSFKTKRKIFFRRITGFFRYLFGLRKREPVKLIGK